MSTAKDKPLRIPETLLAQVSEFISGRMGLCFPDSRRKDLERGLRLAAREFGFEGPEAFLKWLISTPLDKQRIEALARHLTVGETYFFRDKNCFDLLEEKVLPELIEQRRNAGKYLRIWSAGCCTGEEPFSVAILLCKMLRDITDWKITILATDINPAFLRKASTAIYGDWSFRDAPAWIKEKCFSRTKGNLYELLPEIRKRVFFAYHNLAENDYPSALNNTNAMDLILCRNVLMYSTPGHQSQVSRKLRRCLIEGGWLIVGPSEAFDPYFPGYTGVTFQGARFYRRGPQAPPARERSADDQSRSRISGLRRPDRGPVQSFEVRSSLSVHPGSPLVNPLANAEEEASRAKKQDPYEAAFSLYEKGAYQDAMERLKLILSNGNQNARAAALLARILAGQGRLSDAVVFCKRAVAADKCNPGHYYLLATILEEQGRLQDAASELRNTLYLDQDFVLAHLLLGNLALRSGDRKESVRHFRNAFQVLSRRPSEEAVAGAEGLTAGHLMEMIKSCTLLEDV